MRVECVDLRIRCASLRIPRWRVYATDHNGIRSRPLPLPLSLSLSLPRRVLFDAIRLGYVRLGELSSSRHTRACTHKARVRPASTRARDAPLNPVSPVSIGAACNGRTSWEYARRGFERKSNPKGKANERPGRYARRRGGRPLPPLFSPANPTLRNMENSRSIDPSIPRPFPRIALVQRDPSSTSLFPNRFFPRHLRFFLSERSPSPRDTLSKRNLRATFFQFLPDHLPGPYFHWTDPSSQLLPLPPASIPPLCSRARHAARNVRRPINFISARKDSRTATREIGTSVSSGCKNLFLLPFCSPSYTYIHTYTYIYIYIRYIDGRDSILERSNLGHRPSVRVRKKKRMSGSAAAVTARIHRPREYTFTRHRDTYTYGK